VTVYHPLLGLSVLWAGCSSRPSSHPSVGVEAGDCVTDPIGSSRPPDNCPHAAPEADCANAPGYYGEVEPILTSQCKFCHSPGAIANTFLFDTYDQARSWGQNIYVQVLSCQMPPSCASTLSEQDRQTLLRWYLCKTLPFSPVSDGGGGS